VGVLTNKKPTEFRIDELIGLYQQDPERFEALREEWIRTTIEEFPEEYRQRARGLQFQIEMKLRKYHDPVARMHAMFDMFWDQFMEFDRVLHDPQSCLEQRSGRVKTARVLEFRKSSRRH